MVLVFFVIGAVLSGLAWWGMGSAFAHEVFSRQNYRARVLPTAVGAVVPLVAIVVYAAWEVGIRAGAEPDPALSLGLSVVTVAAVGFALLGLLDDLGGTGESGGFTGHLRALVRGRLTTGGVKLFGGAALAVVVVALIPTDGDTGFGPVARLVADAALVALAANLANLFDRAPGRVVKVSLVAFALLLVGAGLVPELAGVGLVLGAGVGLMVPDLREKLMLGDTGANVLGAALGVGVVLTLTPTARTVVVVVLLVLNLLSEVVSFSRVINKVGPLRALDGLGRHA